VKGVVFHFNPMYLMFTLPAWLLALNTQWRVPAAIGECSRVYTGHEATGARREALKFVAHRITSAGIAGW
jgi:hypothetical protein